MTLGWIDDRERLFDDLNVNNIPAMPDSRYVSVALSFDIPDHDPIHVDGQPCATINLG